MCFDRFVFKRDLKILNELGGYNYLSFNSCNLAKILSLYVPKWMQQQVLFYQIIQKKENQNILEKIKKFAQGFLDSIEKKIGIDVILLAGIDY